MNSCTRIWSTAAAIVAALTISVGMAAQDTSSPNHHRHHTYRLYDVGTFGGPSSAGPGVGNGGPDMNARGAAIGGAVTTVPTSGNPNMFACFPGLVPHASKWQDGRTVDLGSLSPSEEGACGHAYVLIPNGHCGDDCEQRIAERQRQRALAAQANRAELVTSKPEAPLTPIERVRNMMRQRYGMPASRPTLRD